MRKETSTRLVSLKLECFVVTCVPVHGPPRRCSGPLTPGLSTARSRPGRPAGAMIAVASASRECLEARDDRGCTADVRRRGSPCSLCAELRRLGPDPARTACDVGFAGSRPGLLGIRRVQAPPRPWIVVELNDRGRHLRPGSMREVGRRLGLTSAVPSPWARGVLIGVRLESLTYFLFDGGPIEVLPCLSVSSVVGSLPRPQGCSSESGESLTYFLFDGGPIEVLPCRSVPSVVDTLPWFHRRSPIASLACLTVSSLVGSLLVGPGSGFR